MSLFKREVQSFSNISADTATFVLEGGHYGITALATWGGGSVDLQRLSPDGSTYVSVLAAAFSANGYKYVSIPQGTYKFVVATATGVYVDLVSIDLPQ